MNQTDWLDLIFKRNTKSGSNQLDIETIKSQILAKLTQVELEGRLKEINQIGIEGKSRGGFGSAEAVLQYLIKHQSELQTQLSRKKGAELMPNINNQGELAPRQIVNIIAGKEDEIRKMGFASIFLEAIETSITKAIAQSNIALLEGLSFEVVEPCEPECDDVRHALHQGSWNAHIVIENKIDELKALKEQQ